MASEANLSASMGKSSRKRSKKKRSKKATPAAENNPKRELTDVEKAQKKETAIKAKQYTRGNVNVKLSNVKDKKAKGLAKRKINETKGASYSAAYADVLNVENTGYIEAEGMERTWRFSQEEILKNVEVGVRQKRIELDLDTFGPYQVRFDRTGHNLLCYGRKGHVFDMQWQKKRIIHENYVRETVRDACYLHNTSMYAVAQKKYAYIYDQNGVELHVLRNHVEPTCLEFLPFHFLLVSTGLGGFLKYHDTSDGKVVAEHRTKMGPIRTMCQNPRNAIIHLGHGNGTVTMWSPNTSQNLVKMLCHRGNVEAVKVDNSGNYMVTAGMDKQMKVWDLRMYKELHSYFTHHPASSIDISQKGLISVGAGPHVHVWKNSFGPKQQSPYLTELFASLKVSSTAFCPFEDILGVGLDTQLQTMIVPGAGEANIDSLETNPFATKKERQEQEVKALLDKIPAELITMDSAAIRKVLPQGSNMEVFNEKSKSKEESLTPEQRRKKKRGRDTAKKRYLKKKANVIDRKKLAIQREFDKRRAAHDARAAGKPVEQPERSVFDRFKSKEL
eukprot:Clim_evm28s225 gene=Clim_evmTU28s225